MSNLIDDISGSSFKTKKIYFVTPYSLWLQIRDAGIFKNDFDAWASKAMYEKLVAEGHIEVEKPKKARKKKVVAGGEAV